MKFLITGRSGFIGSTEEVTILELAERIIQLTGSDSSIEFVSYAKAYGSGFKDMRRRIPDTTKIQNLTGWKPALSLNDALVRLIDFYRSSS